VRHAVFELTVLHEGDAGFLAGPVAASLFDRRFTEEGGLFLASCRFGEDFKFRELARAPAVEIRRRFARGKTGEVEFDAAGTVRLGSLWRSFTSRVRDGDAFGFWVREAGIAVDELVLTVELPAAGEEMHAGRQRRGLYADVVLGR